MDQFDAFDLFALALFFWCVAIGILGAIPWRSLARRICISIRDRLHS